MELHNLLCVDVQPGSEGESIALTEMHDACREYRDVGMSRCESGPVERGARERVSILVSLNLNKIHSESRILF